MHQAIMSTQKHDHLLTDLSFPFSHTTLQLPIRRAFSLSDFQQEIIVSSTVLAALFASLAGGPLNASTGRRCAILLAAAVFAIGSLVLLVAWDYPTLVLGRVIVGMGIGVASLTTPMYIAEVALPRMRGQLVTINAFMV